MTERHSVRALLSAVTLALLACPGAWAGARHGERAAQDSGDRERIQQREQRFRELPREQQQRLRDAEDRYQHMSPEQREALRQRWRDMSDSERDRYRRRVERPEK